MLKPRSFAIDVTPEALQQFRKKLAARGTPDASIRLGIRGGSCNGYSYVIAFEDAPPKETDHTVCIDETKFVIDKKSGIFLSGSRVNWRRTFTHSGFEFENPNEASRCGCGASFSLKLEKQS